MVDLGNVIAKQTLMANQKKAKSGDMFDLELDKSHVPNEILAIDALPISIHSLLLIRLNVITVMVNTSNRGNKCFIFFFLNCLILWAALQRLNKLKRLAKITITKPLTSYYKVITMVLPWL